MEHNDIFRYSAASDEEVLANDHSSFSSSYIKAINDELGSMRQLHLHESCKVYPANYQEDFVQASRRANFRLSDWKVVAFSISDNDAINTVLLVGRSSPKEGMLVDFRLAAATHVFYRGFSVKEASDMPEVEDDVFLESLGFSFDDQPSYELPSFLSDPDFDEEADVMEVQNIVMASPMFEATLKRKIVNLGSSKGPDLDVYEDEDGEIEIEVERPAFEAVGKGKVRNLGYAGGRRKETEQPDHIEVERSSFQAVNSKKPVNLGNSGDSHKTERKPQQNPDIVIEKEYDYKPEMPSFSAGSNKKPQNLGSSSSKPSKPVQSKPAVVEQPKEEVHIEVEKPAFEAQSKKGIVNYDEVLRQEAKDWKVIDLIKVKPNVYHGERAGLYKEGHREFGHLKKAFESLGSKFQISPQCIFCPKAMPEDGPVFSALRKGDFSSFGCLLGTLDQDDDVIDLVVYEESLGLTVVLSMQGAKEIKAVSLNGVSLDDPAMPYLTFEQILKVLGR